LAGLPSPGIVLEGLDVGVGEGEDDEEDEELGVEEDCDGVGFPATPLGGSTTEVELVVDGRLLEGLLGQRLAARRRGEEVTFRAASSLSSAGAASPRITAAARCLWLTYAPWRACGEAVAVRRNEASTKERANEWETIASERGVGEESG